MAAWRPTRPREPLPATMSGADYPFRGRRVTLAWESYREGYDVYVNRLDAGGSIPWGAEGVLLNTLYSSRWDPHLAAVDGGVVVAWTDFRNVEDDLGRDIFADFVSASGVKR